MWKVGTVASLEHRAPGSVIDAPVLILCQPSTRTIHVKEIQRCHQSRRSRFDSRLGAIPPARGGPGSPNVLYVVVDDTGIAAWDTFGGLIEMPNLNRIAKLGLKYSNWHTTALCSPTRSCFMTGRNAHMNGMACITEGANGFPGANAVVPPENGTSLEILVENGYSTFCVGKWHLTPETEQHMAASRRTWPIGRGFERYYGFLGGETNQWYPDLVEDNFFSHRALWPGSGLSPFQRSGG